MMGLSLFQRILARVHPRLQVDEHVSRSGLGQVFVGHSKESTESDDVPQSSQTPLRNAFTVLMSSSKVVSEHH